MSKSSDLNIGEYMSGFSYQNGELYCDEVALTTIATEVGTPCFVYSKSDLKTGCEAFKHAFDKTEVKSHLHYAVKASSNLALLQTIFKQGFGADVVSKGEIARCLKVGLDAKKIVFSGVGKTAAEIDYALAVGVGLFNVESLAELELIERLAKQKGGGAKVCLRVNPNIDAKTHKNITTGVEASKFGLAKTEFAEAVNLLAASSVLEYCGLSCHIGSQIMQLKPIVEAACYMVELHQRLAKQGLVGRVINLGGGVGVPYHESEKRDFSLNEYAKTVAEIIAVTGAELILEPGRIISATSAKLLTQVTYCKESHGKKFVICDAGMTELARPGLYEAYHQIQRVKQNSDKGKAVMDVVGPICESTDWLAKERQLPLIAAGDLLAIADCGGYSASMSSNYNSRPYVAEVLVHGSCYTVIRRPQQIEALWQNETILE